MSGMSSRVLVAFDESTQANFALRYALSTYPDAEIHVLYVNDLAEQYGTNDRDGEGDLYDFPSEELYERSRTDAEELLERAAEIARDFETEIQTERIDGEVTSTIVTYAEEHDIDHIILGSHGRNGLARYLLGSVAESVARRAHVPVTIIRDEDFPQESER
ncbi:universal stress protein [Natrinema sp. 1APR25-10V2]|uniref:universal stress protein n=1 Tax=Natrinema sp. 1APR25-10V2 TaxID=2951081 RepID=UPI0028765449|nr:universal stress protein [Natrinema sp. 1APR25-10V2]MDS0477231.1 universal stress protein [Natrinema sp. 1APR25-10V2]